MSSNPFKSADFHFLAEEDFFELNFLEPDRLGSDTLGNNLETTFANSDFLDSTQSFLESSDSDNLQAVIPGGDLLTGLKEEVKELVFVDDTVEDYQSIVAGIDAEVITLDSSQDGIEQITDVLAGYKDLDAIHLISHGDGGLLKLGDTTLDWEGFNRYSEELIEWGEALAEEADFLIYGCNVAEGEEGEVFVNRLSNLTGADVAASDDLTGNSDLGGDWDLEYALGEIETEGIASDNYQAVFGSASLNNGTLTYTATEAENLAFTSDGTNLIIQEDGSQVYSTLLTNITTGIEINTGNGDDTISISNLDFNSSAVSLSMDGEGGDDTVNFTGNVGSFGGSLSVNAEAINVASGVTISTRQVDGSDNSTANSGNISFTGQDITLASNASILAQVEDGSSYTPGTIDFTASNTGSSNDAGAGIYLEDSAVLKGGAVTLDVDADSSNTYDGSSEDDSVLDEIEEAFDGYLNTGVGFLDSASLVYGHARANAESTIDIGTNSQIEASSLTLDTDAAASAEVNAFSLQLGLAAAYGESNPTAKVNIADGVQIDTTGDLTFNSHADSNLILAASAISLAKVKGNHSVFFGATVSQADINSTVDIASGSIINVGGNLDIDATTDKDHSTSLSLMNVTSKGGYGLGLNLSLSDMTAQAFLDGSAEATGNIEVDAQTITTANEAGSTVVVGEPDSVAAKFLIKGASSALSKIPGLKNKSQNSGQTALTGSILYADSDNTAEARIGDGATVKSGGNLDVRAKVTELPEFSSASKAKVKAEDNVDGDSSQTKGATVATSIADLKNTAKAYIGDGAVVDAAGAMNVESEVDMPFDDDFTTVFTDPLAGGVEDLISNISTHIKKDAGISVLFSSWAKAKANANQSFAGSFSYFDVDNVSEAYIGENALINQDSNYRSGNQTVDVYSHGNSFTLNFAGNFNPLTDLAEILKNAVPILNNSVYNAVFSDVKTSDNGVGLGAVYANTDNTIKAIVKDGATIYADALGVNAELTNTDISIGATGSVVGVAKDSAANISLSLVDRVDRVTAHISDLATVDSSGTITVNALDNSNTYNFTGGFAAGENQGIGVAATFDIIDRTTDAILGNTSEKLSFSALDDVNIDDDSIAIAEHGLSTGDALVYNNTGETSIGNLAQETVYYAIVVDENTIQLATSQSNALAGTAQDLSSIGTGFDHELIVLDSLVFAPSGGDRDTETIFNPTEGVEGYEFIEPAGESIVVDAIDVSTISNNTITLTSHGLSDGDIVTYYNLANEFTDVESDEELTIENIGVLEHEITYQVIYVDDDNFQLADVNDNTNTPLDLSHSGIDEDLNQHYFTRDTLDLDEDFIVYADHGFATGDAVVYSNDGDTSIGVDNADEELVDGQTYYIIKVDDHRLQLAETVSDATNGTAIDLTSKGDGIHHSLRTPVINLDTNEINLSGHGWETGERIVYSNNGETSVGSLTDGDSYYVIAIDSDTIKLASNYADAVAYNENNDTAIAISSTGSGEEHSFTRAIINLETDAITLTDHELSTGDALIYGNGGNTSISNSSGELTAGATYYAIVIDENTIQLAASETDANNSLALDLTATGTGEEHQFFEKITVSLTQGTVNAGDTVTVNSENSGAVIGGAIAGTYASGSTQYADDPFAGSSQLKDYSLITGTSGGLSVAGTAVVNYIDDKANAYIKGVDLYVPDNAVSITAKSDNEIYAIGGSVAIAAALGSTNMESSYGIAGSFELNFVESETKAYVANSIIDSGSLNITATNDNYLLAIAASGSGSFSDSGVAFAGTLTVNDVVNDTQAYIGSFSNVDTSGDTAVTATDNSSILSVAGALQYSGQYGIGASIGLNYTENTTLAYVENADISATNLSLDATNNNTIHAFAVAAGASLDGMAAEFSLTYNTTNNVTEAYIDNSYSETETNLSGNLSLSATDDSEIFSLAGVLGLSLLLGATDNYTATLGISIAINEIENETRAKIKDGRVVVQGDLELIADSTSDIQAYSVAGSGSASWSSTGLVLSGAGAGTRNDVNNTIEASIENADVDITGTATLSATDNSTIIADAGGVAISLAIAGDSWSTSAAISVGAGIANNEISNTVTAFISDAVVEADSNLSVSAISNATIDAFALGAAVSATYSSSGIGISLAGAGAGTENKISNEISAYIADDSDVTTNNSGAIAITAQDNSKVTADAGGYAIALKFGNGITNGSASVGVSMADNDIENTVKAYISDSVVTSAAGIDVTATATGTIDLFSIGAAASGSIGSSGLNVALSGAGTGVENKIDNTIQAYINDDSTVESKNNGAINLIATDSSTVVADAGGFAVAVGIGSGFSGGVTAGVATAENIISNTVRAYIDNSKVTADGDLTLDATATSTIDNLTMAGAVSVAASESAALSASGAGTSTINELNNTIEAYIENDSDIDSNSSISLNAEDNSTIESVAVGGSISISGSTGASFSLAIAGVEVENTISNTVRAYIGDTSSDGTTIDAAGDLNLTADSNLTFEDNYAVAASFAASAAPASAAFSGAGANVITETTNTVEAFIRNLTADNAIETDNVTLTATDTPTIKPTVGSGALAASFVGASVSVSLTDTTINNSVNTYIDNSQIKTTSDVNLTATSTPTVESEAVTTSVAAAIGGAGAGGEVSVTISSDVASYISGNAIVDAEDVAVTATQTPTITADVFGVAISSIAAVGASVTDIEFKGTTKAYVKNSDVYTKGNLDITATTTPSLDAEVTALAAGITTSGVGNGVTVQDNSTTEAYASNSSYLDIDNTLNITATAQPELIGNALGVGAAAGVQAGYSEVIVTVAPEINAYIGSGVDVIASDLNLTAQTLLPDTGISAQADASASGGALYGSVNAANAEAINNASTTLKIDSSADLEIANTATLQTDLNSSQDAYADGYNGGILALGFNFAEANSDTTNKITFASGAEVNADSLIVAVNGTEDNYAEAVAGGGGIISGRAAEATTDSVSDTQVNINSDIEVDTLDIGAEHTATFNSKSDSVNASVVGGSGAYTENTVTADITVNFNSNANVTATDDFDVTVVNNIEQEQLSDQNAEAASGGLLDGSAVETVTTINNSSVINVNDGAVLAVGDDDRDTIDNLDFTILNDVSSATRAKLANGGAISKAKAEAEVTNNTNEAIINIENADITSTHDIDFSVRSIVDLETEAKASAWGISGVSKGESLVEATVDNEINLNDGASVIAEQDANFYVGENSSGATNDISLDAETDLWNKSASPMAKSDIDADSNLTLNNTIYIHDDAELATNENINLITNDDNSTYSVDAEGEGTDLYLQVISGVASLFGGDVSSVITNDSTSVSFNNGIEIDGSLIAGQNNQQYLYITGSNGSYSYDMSDQIESEPTVTTEDVTASIDETISALETELSQYENSDSEGDAARTLTLSAEIEFWENEKAKIGDGDISVINLPNISASVGSINIAGDYLTGTGNIEARGDAEIDVINSTDAYFRVNDVNINDNYGGELFFNNVAITDINQLESDDFNSIVTGSDLGEPEINILNDSDSILEIKGSLVNRNGSISLKNTSGSIYVTEGEISAKTIDIESGESFFLSDGYLYTVDSSPESLWNDEVQEFIEESEDGLIYDNGAIAYSNGENIVEYATSNQSTVNSKLSEAENPDGGVSAATSIFIASEYINISGNLRSGVSDYDLTIDDSLTTIIDGFKTEYDSNISSVETINLDEVAVYGDSVYVFSSEAKWSDAQAEAEDLGGNLVTINDAAEQAWLETTFAGQSFWTGLNDVDEEGTYVWTSGESSDYRNWNDGEPNNYSDEDHISFRTDGTWNDAQGEKYYNARLGLVEIPLSSYGITESIYNYNGNYYFVSSSGSWEDAQGEATAWGGNLVTINSAEEQAWLEETFGGSEQLWIGYNDRDSEDSFEWVSGESSSYTNWNSNEPNNSGTGEDYGVLRTDGLWNDANNNTSRRGIIELSGVSSIGISSLLDLSDYLRSSNGDNINSYYDPTSDRIIVDEVQVEGGYIQLVGNVLSTGNGNIEVMDGFGNISIDNDSSYDLQLNTLNTGGEGAEGKIIIIDNGSGTPVTTTYTKDDNGIVKTVDGEEVNSDADIYTPQEAYPYNWYYQKEQTLTLTPLIGSASSFAQAAVSSNQSLIPSDYEIYGDSLYFLTDGKQGWFNSQAEAEEYGGNLVAINDAAENTWINDTFSSYGDLWIGYSDSTDSRVGSSEGNFIWQNGDTSTYTNWNSGEPNNGGNEDYAEIYASSGRWNDTEKNSDNQYGLVEIPLDEMEFSISGIDTTYETQDPEVYVYEPIDLSQYSGFFGAIVSAIVSAIDSTFNFTEAVEDPSYKGILYNQSDLQVDEDNNLITLDIGSHYVNAVPHQYDIDINFFGHDTATIDVDSTKDIWLTGDITNLAGDVNLTSTSGSIAASSEIEIETNNLTLNPANGSIGDSDIAINTNLDGGTVDATATGDIYLKETTGDIAVDTVTTSGNVNIEAYGNLEADSSSAKITGQEINLTSETGNIGLSSQTLKIDSGSSETGSVTLDAAGDISIQETSGDLYLVSADANDGDVSISVSNGDLIDYNPEETEDLAARAELLDTTWSEMELTNEDISTTDTDETGAASALADEAVTAYEQSKETEYELYWQYRNLTQVTDEDDNVSYTFDDYDAEYEFSFEETETAQLEELGYSESAISELEDNKTEQYHSLHEELAASGLTDDYDPDYTYTATAEESAEISEGAVWTVDELTRVVNPSLLLPISDTEIDIEADNVRANNLTLDVDGGIGVNEGDITITVRDGDGNILGISDEDLLYLLSAESKDITYLDDSGNEVADFTNNVDSIYTIAIAQIDDLDFDATGELDVTATADAYLGSEGDITINDLDVGNNEIRLKSGNGITGTDNSTHITADNIVIEAGDSSIGSSTNPIEIETNTITARGNNDIYINQASGDLEIEQIYSGDNVDLTVVGTVSDANNTDDENIRSTDIVIDSSDNDALGSSDNYLDVYVESGGTYEIDTSQDAYILNTYGTGIIDVDFTGTTGTLSYSDSTYTITDSASGTSVNFIGFDIINLNFASQDNNFTVESLASETTLNIVGDSGNDSIELGNDLEGTVIIDGGTGTNSLTLNDTDDTAANSYQITETEITGHINNTISYSNIDNIDIQSGSNKNDVLTVINETETTRTITADNTSISDSSFSDISHSAIETIDYYAESGSNDLDLTSFTDTGISLTIYSNLGDDVNTLDLDAPGNHVDIVLAVDENASNLQVADLNHASNSFTLSGTDAAKFEILNDNELHFIATPDFETQSSYELTVIANGTDEINLTISITDINETPTLSLDNSNLTLAEDTDTTSGVKIGDITITDDALGEETLSLSGDDADLFELVNDTELYLVAGTELDYETNPNLDVTVTADDGTFSVDLDITVNLTDVNEAASVDFDFVNVADNQVLVLDGDGDYVETNSDVANLTSADFTVEAWIQTSETNQGILGRDDGDSSWENGEKAFYINSAGKVEFIGKNNGKVNSNSAVNDGKWHHVMVVWDATNEQGYIYIDGIEDTATDTYYINKEDNDGDTLKLGLAYVDDYFAGKLDKIIVWNKALSYEEIQSNLASGVAGDEENIVAFYDFEDENFNYYNTLVDNAYLESDRTILTLAENTNTTSRVKIADINIGDDALGTNNLTLSGDDSSLFELDGTELYLSAGVTLDYETNPILDVDIEVDDDTIGSTPDDTVNLRIIVSDSNDAPVITAEYIADSLPEDTDTTERIKIADISITDADSIDTEYTVSLIGDDVDLFELDGTELYLVAGATLDYETNPNLEVSIRVDDPSLGDTFDSSLGIVLPITNTNEIFTLDHNNTNQSLTLDGDGDYADTNAGIVDLTDADFTLEAWIKTSTTGQTIITKNDSDSNFEQGEKAFYLDNEGKLVFFGSGNSYIEGTTPVNDDQWHHVAVVWDKKFYLNGDGYIYVDGVNDTSSDSYRSSYGDANRHTLKLGFSGFSGKIDEVRIWDKVLNADEISNNFNRTSSFTGEEDNLVAYYTFQTASIDSATVTDDSGNGYDLTLVDDAITGIASDLAINRDDSVVFFAENSADGASVKIADITIIDDNYSTNDLILAGDDADKFSISGTEILLNAGTTFDYETDGEFNFKIEFNDDTIEAAEEVIVKAIDVLELTNTVSELDEDTDTSERIQVAELNFSEAALNSNTITLSGDDAEYFEVEDLVLYLKADTTLDFETQAAYNVTVGLDDVVGSTADAAVDFTLTLNDVNEAPTAINLTTDSTNYTDNLFLSGNDNYIETNAEILDLTADFTLETWIQTTANNQGIIVKNNGDSKAETGEKSLYISSGKLRFFSHSDGFIYGNTKVNDGKLHHVSVVWDSTNEEGYIYVDGVLDATGKIDDISSDQSSQTVKIGSPDYYIATKHFSGFLGDVRLWNVTRTQEEILADLATTLTGTETGLVANYNNFNSDYNNTTITDATGNHNGTLIGYDATLTKIALPENIDTTNSIKLAEFTLTDEDASNTNQVTITGDYSNKFELVNTGERSYELYLIAGAAIDYETTPEIEINIEVSDSELDDEAIVVQTFTVVVANENEAPSLALEYTVTDFDEDTITDERIEVAEIEIIDEDDNDNLNLLTLTGDDAEYFAIDNNKVYLQAGTTLDYETNPQLDVTVEVNDATFGTGIDDSVDLSIVINDANDASELIVTNNNDSTKILSLDGGSYEDGDYVEIDSELLDLDTSYTFEAWFKTSQKNRGIFIKGDGDSKFETGEKALYIRSYGDLGYITLNQYDTYRSRYANFDGDTRVTDGEWHHVAFVLDQPNSTAYIYLDGNLEVQDTDDFLDSADNDGDILRLGTWNNSSFFNGEMRDIRFWNTARSQTEIQTNLNNKLTGTESGLVAYYDLSNSSDTQIIDQTGNGINGTLVDDASKIETLIIPEDTVTGSGFVIAELAINDEDTASDFLNNGLSLSGTDSEFLEIVDNKLYFKADTILDYETKTQYDFSIDLDDGTNSNSVNFEIGISDVNEAPSLTLESTTTTISEDTDTSSRIKVANLFINDDSQAHDFILTGDDGDKFQVVSTTDDFYNFELEADYDRETPNFTINNADISFTTDTSGAIKIADLAITDGAGITSFSLSGDDADNLEIVNDSELYLKAGVTIDANTTFDLTVEASDGIDTETASLNISLGELDGSVKELYLKANETLDYDTNPQLDVTIEASDGEYSDTASYSLTLTNVDEAPIFTLENIVESLEENTDTTGGYKVADLSISDDDTNDNIITISGDDADKFAIINDSELYLVDGTTLDYENQTEYNITVTLSDINHSTEVNYSLEVINQIENPVTITFANVIYDGDVDGYGSIDGVISGSRDTSERIKVADIVITGGEGNETFYLTGYDADDFEVEGNTIYLKAGVDIAKYGVVEALADFTVNVDGSDSSQSFDVVFVNPGLEIYYDYYNWVASEDSFVFPETVDVASGSTEYELEFYNFGDGTLNIESATITGTHSSDFGITTDLVYPLSLEYDFSEFFMVEFNPSSGGELTATLEVISNDADGNNPYIIYLTGTGIGSEINITQGETDYNNGDSQDFGIVEIDTETSQQTFTITNTGTEALSISDVAITGENANEFTTDFSVSEIAAGTSADMTVNFTPTAGGDRSATLTINNNDDDESAFAINLTGNGAIAEIDLVQGDTELPSGTTQDFGSVNVDTGEIQQTFTIQNTGSKTLNIDDIAVTGTNASYFILENSFAIANTQLEAGDSTDLTITFNPRTAETASATLTINSDDSNESAYTINLTGTGTESTQVSGSDNDDNIDNDEDNQTIDAGGGDDTVTGNDNGERLTGGDGADQVYGEDGNDRAYGDAGDDVIVGGAGRDFLRGGADNDIMFGGDDSDYLVGDDGEDYLDGEGGSDRLRGGNDSDTFVLTSGNGTNTIFDFDVDEDNFELSDLSVDDLTFEDIDSYGLIKFGDETLVQVRNVTASELEDYFNNRYQA